MSIFSSIANAAHTFVSWFEKEWAKFQKDAPTIEVFIEQGVVYATGVLKIVLSQMDAASPAAAIITKAIQDLLTLSAVAYDAGAHPTLASNTALEAALSSILYQATKLVSNPSKTLLPAGMFVAMKVTLELPSGLAVKV